MTQSGVGAEPVLLMVLPPFIGRNTQPQRVQFDKPFCVFLVIRPIIRLKGGDRLIKQ
jgi:hypothetical protein